MSYQSRSLSLVVHLVSVMLSSLPSFSQDGSPSVEPPTWGSEVIFNNRVAGLLDAPVQRPDGSGAGAGVTAQLFRVNEDGTLLPLFPTATFRTSSPAAAYYLDQVQAFVPGVGFGDTAILRLRAWEGADYASAHLKGESNDILIHFDRTLPNLLGLRGFILTPDGSQSLLPQVIEPKPRLRGGAVVTFNNRVAGVVDAPVQRPDGSGAGAGVTAQLLRVDAGGSLHPLFPVTTFRTSSVAASYYVNGVVVDVPDVFIGDTITFRMRAGEGLDYESATLRGESRDFTVRVGGGTVPPANLWDLRGFTLAPQLLLSASQFGTGLVVVASASSTGPKAVRVQSSRDLTTWQDISGDIQPREAGPLIQENIVLHRDIPGQRFYRVVAR